MDDERWDGHLSAGWLRQHRHAAGLSQERLAELSGLSLRTIKYIERERTRRPHPQTVFRLRSALRDASDTTDDAPDPEAR